MHSRRDLQNIRNLESFLGFAPGEPICLDRCSLEEAHYWRTRHRPFIPTPESKGKTIGCLVLNHKTNEISSYRCRDCSPEKKETCEYHIETSPSSEENEPSNQ